MHKSVYLVCLLVVLPLLAHAGNIGKDDEDSPSASKKFKVKGDPPLDVRGMFNIPENMTEEEWHEEQYEEFKKKEMNAFQKKQFADFERWRFSQWQMQKFQIAQEKKHKELAKEHEKFVLKHQVDAKKEAQKHNEWLDSLLANEKDRKKLLKQIRLREAKEQGDL